MSQGIGVLLAAALFLSACSSARPPVAQAGGDAATLVEAVEQGTIGRPAVLYFHARACAGCPQVTTELEQIASDFDGQIEVVKVDMDNPAAAAAISHYRITAPPTFVMVATDGTALAQISGWPGREPMARMLAQLAAEAP